jgi:hypothetical protein
LLPYVYKIVPSALPELRLLGELASGYRAMMVREPGQEAVELNTDAYLILSACEILIYQLLSEKSPFRLPFRSR